MPTTAADDPLCPGDATALLAPKPVVLVVAVALVDADGRVLLQSAGFQSPKDAGQCIAQLKREGFSEGGAQFALGEEVAAAEVSAALEALAAAEAEKQKAKS